MKRRDRSLNVFSISALDMFASALGAFILIMLILMPYYLKIEEDLRDDLAAAKSAQQRAEQDLKKKSAQLAAAQQKIQTLQSKLKNSIKFALLGLTTRAESFVLVIDMSGSMDTYIDVMLKTVTRITAPMNALNQVQVIGYHEPTGGTKLHYWQRPYKLNKMDRSAKQALKQFALKLSTQFGGGTPTKAALTEALKYPGQAIILLTDGAPNSPPSDIINHITQLNGGKKEIHCVALGNYANKPEFVRFLIALARKNRGDFVGISN